MEFVDLTRTFRDLTSEELQDPELLLALADSNLHGGFGWEGLLKSPRVIVLAEAGSGKTAEMREQVRRLQATGTPAFFLPLEVLGAESVEDVLSRDDKKLLDAWKADDSSACWFFLDAVDELKLGQGRLDRALRNVANATDGQLHRIRVVVSCRPSDWRPSTDLATLLCELPPPPVANQQSAPEDVFLSALRNRDAKDDVDDTAPKTKVAVLLPLGRRQIEQFATALGVTDTTAFLEELRRQDAWSFARRPLDLSELVLNWRAVGRLGTRAEQHEANVIARLKDDPDRPDRGNLSDDRLRLGAERLALAMSLVRARSIRVPEQTVDVEYSEGALEPASILQDWSEDERKTLLRRGLFDPATYGRVRFHHRSVQEYLAARYLSRLRDKGMSVKTLSRLLFAEKYGLRIVIPSMRPIASWLAISDRHVRRELIAREPETLLAMGDPESLPIQVRRDLIKAFGLAYGAGSWRGLRIPTDAIRRIAHPELADVVRELWGAGPTNDDVRELLLEVIEQGKIENCADLAVMAARDRSLPNHHRLIAVRAMVACSRDDDANEVARSLLTNDGGWSDELVANLVDELAPAYLSISNVLALLHRITSPKAKMSFAQAMRTLSRRTDPRSDAAVEFRNQLSTLISNSRDNDNTAFRFSGTYDDIAPALAELCLRQVESTAEPVVSELVNASVIASRFGPEARIGGDVVNRLHEAFRVTPLLRGQAFWAELAFIDSVLPGGAEGWLRLRRTLHEGLVERLDEQDNDWLVDGLKDTSMPERREVALHGLLNLWVSRGRNVDELASLIGFAKDDEGLLTAIRDWSAPPRAVDPQVEEMERDHERHRVEAVAREQQRLDDWTAWRDALCQGSDSGILP